MHTGSILEYRPSTGGNLAFGILYEVVAIILIVNLVARRDWWALCLPIGACLQGLGFFLRIPLADNPSNLGLYIIMDFFIVLSPACYFAFNYIWFGRLCCRIEENGAVMHNKRRKHITFLSPRKFGVIFIVSDVTTFLIQAGGGGMQVKENLKDTGNTIFLIGIIAQFASYLFFLTLSIPLFRIISQQKNDVLLCRRTRELFVVLLFSSVWIIVRSIYRTIEMAQGFRGTFSQNEAWFFGLDSAPLLLSIGVYTIAWPSTFIELQQRSLRPLYATPWQFMKRKEQYVWQHEGEVVEFMPFKVESSS